MIISFPVYLQALVDKDPGLTGNLLVERLVGAHVDLVSKEEYASVGSVVCLPYSSPFKYADLLCIRFFAF